MYRLWSRSEMKWRVLSPCIGYRADFSHHSYLPEVAVEQTKDTGLIFLKLQEQTENYRYYLHVSAMEQIRNGKSYLHVSTMEQILATSLIFLKLQEAD
ncbi:hypothetical protein PVK06_005888 [Gossypium arboreum]|uniref:Uncharacterized protein n=1 Tax=Gossypium arboreum TaxID=29729 RepID=A0ABR0QVS7_GOSAR|nr:hypothetical protein PVK06_005888 [Gossypium arboreum]